MSTKATKREDIERAAIELFGQRGFHGTSMPELAKVAGVGPGTIYRHFQNKEALVNSLYQKWKMQLGTEVYMNLPMQGSWRARFKGMWRGLFAFNANNPGVIDFLDFHHHGTYLDEQSKMIEAQSVTVLFALVAGAQVEEILVDLPPPALLAMAYSSFIGLVRAEREGYIQLDEALISLTEERVWAMIRR